VYKKVTQATGLVSKIRYYVNRKTLIMMYYSFVYCHLHYGILTWANVNQFVLKPLKILQNDILRLMSFKKSKDTVNLNKLYISFDMLKLEGIYELELVKFMYQFHNNTLPPLFNNYFKRASKTRFAANRSYFIPRVSPTKGQASSLFVGTKVWNNIPLKIRFLPYGNLIE